MRVRQLLAKLLEGGERRDDGLWWAVTAGDDKRATRLAADVAWPEIELLRGPTGPPWERAASWAALGRAGPTAPAVDVTALRDRLLDDAEPTPDVGEAYGPGTSARGAAAAVILQLVADERDATEFWRSCATRYSAANGPAGAAGDALELVTEPGHLRRGRDSARRVCSASNVPAVRNAAGLIIGSSASARRCAIASRRRSHRRRRSRRDRGLRGSGR